MHHWNQKQILYDQSVRVPMSISWPGKSKHQVSKELVSTALDIPQTILDFAGVTPPSSMRGVSLRPLVMGNITSLDREYVAAETIFAQGENPLGLRGKMLRTRQYKYCVYDVGECREQLFDMDADPGETNNLAVNKEHQDALNRHRRLMVQWADDTGDEGFPYVRPA